MGHPMNGTPDDGVPDDAGEDAQANGAVPENTSWTLVDQRPVDVAEFDALTTTIIELIAEAEGIEPRDVKYPPLYDVADTAALQEAFFGPDRGDGPMQTEFMYRDFRILVRSDGWVELHKPED